MVHIQPDTGENFNSNEYQFTKDRLSMQMKTEFNSKVVTDNLIKLKNLRNKTKSMNSYIHNFKPKGNKPTENRWGKCAEWMNDIEVTEWMLAKVPLINSGKTH